MGVTLTVIHCNAPHEENCTEATVWTKVNTTPRTIKTKTKTQSVLLKEIWFYNTYHPWVWYNSLSFMKGNNKKTLSFKNSIMYFVSFYWFNLDKKQMKNGAKTVNKQTIQHSFTGNRNRSTICTLFSHIMSRR